MKNNESKPCILWVLQNNQVSPHIADFLKFFKTGIGKIDINFLVPESNKDNLKIIEPLSPTYFQAARHDRGNTYDNFTQKKDLIRDLEFSDGLKVWQALLLDDLGAGNITETIINLKPGGNIKGIILQIPTPLGSSAEEELIFQAWVRWAHKYNIFIVGYELLSLYTRWTTLPSILDGIITTNTRSYDYLTSRSSNINGKVWHLPRHEGKVFSVGTGNLWHNGLQAPYIYKMKYNIPNDKLIAYIPHNVAMSYEYRKLLEGMQDYASDLHLMFCIGKDQVRGTHTHEEIIKTISADTLNKFHSYSFHDINAPWEMVMADIVIACSECFSSLVAQANGIPSIIIDETVPEAELPYLQFVHNYDALNITLKDSVASKKKTTDLTSIIYQIVNQQHKKQSIL